MSIRMVWTLALSASLIPMLALPAWLLLCCTYICQIVIMVYTYLFYRCVFLTNDSVLDLCLSGVNISHVLIYVNIDHFT
jgi:hypothetical protein